MTQLQLPDEIIEELRPLLEAGDELAWEVGYYLVGVVDELRTVYEGAYGVRSGRAEIHRQLAARLGCVQDTLRDREVMARAWSREDRERYHPLTYSQLRACKAAGEKRYEYAEWALEHLPAPVVVIRARVKANGDEVPAWMGRWERVCHLCELLVGDRDTPEGIRGICEGVLGAAA